MIKTEIKESYKTNEDDNTTVYDFFNVWFAYLLNPIEEKNDPIKLVRNISNDFSTNLDKLLEKLKDAELESNEKVTFLEGKKHIRFPNLSLCLDLPKRAINLTAKIRINPCILSKNINRNHTKIWIIFYNNTQESLLAEDIYAINKKLETISKVIKEFVLEKLGQYLINFNEKEEAYLIQMLNASLDINCSEDNDNDLNFIHADSKNYDKLDLFLQKTKTSKFIKKYFSDLFLLNFLNKPNNYNDHFIAEKDKVSWKITNSMNYQAITRISSIQKNRSAITTLTRLTNNEQRSLHLYSEPLKKAIDISQSL